MTAAADRGLTTNPAAAGLGGCHSPDRQAGLLLGCAVYRLHPLVIETPERCAHFRARQGRNPVHRHLRQRAQAVRRIRLQDHAKGGIPPIAGDRAQNHALQLRQQIRLKHQRWSWLAAVTRQEVPCQATWHRQATRRKPGDGHSRRGLAMGSAGRRPLATPGPPAAAPAAQMTAAADLLVMGDRLERLSYSVRAFGSSKAGRIGLVRLRSADQEDSAAARGVERTARRGAARAERPAAAALTTNPARAGLAGTHSPPAGRTTSWRRSPQPSSPPPAFQRPSFALWLAVARTCGVSPAVALIDCRRVC